LLQVEARLVRLPFVRTVKDDVKVIGIRITGDPAQVPHHQLAGARIAQMLGPLRFLEFDPQPHAIHELAP